MRNNSVFVCARAFIRHVTEGFIGFLRYDHQENFYMNMGVSSPSEKSTTTIF